MKDEPQVDPKARRQRLTEFATDAERASREYAEGVSAINERTAQLRRQRLAAEASSRRDASGKATRSTPVRRAPSKARAAARGQEDSQGAASIEAKSEPFEPGQRVTISARKWGTKGPKGVYRIVSRLPADHAGNVYRIRSEVEQHDRVVGEAQLTAAK